MRQTNPRRPPDAEEQAKVDAVYRVFTQCSAMRPNFATMWDEVAQLVWPNMRDTFFRENFYWPGQKKTDRQVDATGMVALGKFAAICDSMLTPFSSKWHSLEATDPSIQKNRQVRLWFEEASNVLYRTRYMASANYRNQNQAVYKMVGAFGNGPMFIDQLHDMHSRPVQGFRYKAIPIGECYIRINFQGQVDAFVRPFRYTARQAMQQWGHDMLPQALDEAQDKDSEQLFDFFHCVYPNPDYDASKRLSVRGKPFISHYVSCTERRLMQEGGYNTFPLPVARYGTPAPNEVYSRGPMMDILPALKTLNAEKAVFLKAGHRAADPVLLVADDGISDFSLVPGAINKGSVNSDGRPLVHTIQPGDIQITEKMMDEERALIGDVSLTRIFQALVENPNMTATQVIELINQKGVFLAPTVGGMTEYLDATIERELDLAVRLNLLPPMPGLLKEAKGEYKIVYTNPLSKAARAGEAAGWLRTLESALQVAGQTGDPSVLDIFDVETAFNDIARIQDSRESWMRSDEAVSAIRQARGQAQAQQLQVQALPAQAAMLKAQAAVKKAGGNIGQPAAA